MFFYLRNNEKLNNYKMYSNHINTKLCCIAIDFCSILDLFPKNEKMSKFKCFRIKYKIHC